MSALAYHIMWTTYGTWLHGDARGWVKWGESGVKSGEPDTYRAAVRRMVESAVLLSDEQRAIVERTIEEHCRIRDWTLHAVNARSNHVHVVVSAAREPDDVMNQLKAWCSRKLSDAAELTEKVAKKAGRRRWFTEGGDKEIIDDERYLENAIRYVLEGQ